MPESNQVAEHVNVDLYRIIGELTVQIKGQELYINQLKGQIEGLKKAFEEFKK